MDYERSSPGSLGTYQTLIVCTVFDMLSDIVPVLLKNMFRVFCFCHYEKAKPPAAPVVGKSIPLKY